MRPAPDLPLWDGPDTRAVIVARNALREVGRGDIAERVVPNRAGMPSVLHVDRDREVVVKAFLLGHLAEGHHAELNDSDGELGIWCQECYERLMSLAEEQSR